MTASSIVAIGLNTTGTFGDWRDCTVVDGGSFGWSRATGPPTSFGEFVQPVPVERDVAVTPTAECDCGVTLGA
jgi:hypothetical protein